MWAAILGRGLVALAFASAVLAMVAFLRGNVGLGRRAFLTHAASTVGVIALMFVLFFGHRYEFQYIWKHLNNEMPMRFVLSAFWGGQEGGFLLWMFWHNVLALFILRRADAWQREVMTVLSAIEAFLGVMLLGIYFGDFQLGLDPFLLLREAPNNLGLPWTARADYLTSFAQFTDGQGLNPLLQNYWMTIHPPTLFLGFAACSIPFAYAIGALWHRDLTGWIKPVLPWTFFAVGILGAGILMGGAWAYEALSFGGFWAWDPVENSSLVPWMVLVASAHLLLINRNKKKPIALFSTVYLSILAFLLVLYSTFLTKSGVLGDTSVHSFVDSGILPQLLAYLLSFVALGHLMLLEDVASRKVFGGLALATLGLVAIGHPALGFLAFLAVMGAAAIRAFRREFKGNDEEDALWSREFWMFVGSLLLVLGAVHITWQTSVPVFNLFLEPFAPVLSWAEGVTGWGLLGDLAQHDLAPGTDLDRTYHMVQVPLAVLIFLLIGLAQWLKYKNSDIQVVAGKLMRALLGAVVLTGALLVVYDFKSHEIPRVALLFATLFAALSNADYIVQMWKGKLDTMGSPLAHVGFALTIFGAVLSTAQKDVISQNRIGDIATLNEELNNATDLLLMEGDTLPMGPYFVSYRERRQEGIHVLFDMAYFERAPMAYTKDQIVVHEGMVWQALDDHLASPTFGEDVETHWNFLPFPQESQTSRASRWVNGTPGDEVFTLSPRIQLNEQMGNAPEPDTKHFAFRDLYTHIKWGRVTPPETDEEGWLGGQSQEFVVGDSMFVGGVLMTVDSLRVVRDEERPEQGLLDDDLALAACIGLRRGRTVEVHDPLYIVRGNTVVPDLYEADGWGLRFRIEAFDPENETVEMTVWEHESVRRDFVVMQAVIFPQINWLWLGCILMTLGSFLAVRMRIRQRKTSSHG
ncbi:MAG: cytochrome c biogenesis protein CcsA [Bacteroidota bacterium]|nr:cytochrome c biogenesis protein CcsA [Bacteroidota bacterium]